MFWNVIILFMENKASSIRSKINDLYQYANRTGSVASGILKDAIDRFTKLHAAEGAAAISFYTIFSLPPLLIIIVTVASYTIDAEIIRSMLVQTIQKTVPVTDENIVELIEQMLKQRTSLGIFAIISFFWSGSGVLSSLMANINRAWPSAKPRNIFEKRFISLIVISCLIILLTLSVLFTTTSYIIEKLSQIDLLTKTSYKNLNDLTNLAVRFLIFLALYSWIPKAKVHKQSALIASLCTTIAWEISMRLFRWYLSINYDYYNFIYGSLGSLVAFMFWVYLLCLIIVFGAYLGAAIDNIRVKTSKENITSRRDRII
mgnify:CR=1 FL=1